MADDSQSTLHVTGLPTAATDDQVKSIFATYGGVKSVKVLPVRTDKTDAAAIVTMDSGEQAKWIIDNVSGTVPPGLAAPLVIKKKITNDWSKGYGKGYGGMDQWQMMQMMMYYKGGKGGGKGYGKRSGLSSFTAEKKVWIGGLPEEADAVTYQQLQAHFPGSKFAAVMKGKGAGTGGVAFATAEEAAAAIATLNGSSLAAQRSWSTCGPRRRSKRSQLEPISFFKPWAVMSMVFDSSSA